MNGRIALCHEWLTTWGGSELVSSHIARRIDVDTIYTFTAIHATAERAFGAKPVVTSRLGSTELARTRWQLLLPVMSHWWRNLDLSPFDLVITCSHAVVNSVSPRPDAIHVSYCCTPMRYAWDPHSEIGRIPHWLHPLWPAAAAALRASDRRRVRSVDLFLADSKNVAGRIRSFYGKRAIVLYPPVDTDFFCDDASATRTDALLVAGRLVAYKRPDIAVRAANQLGIRMIVAGDGPELPALERIAGPTVEFRVRPDDTELRNLYRTCKALVFPGVEDFGVVPVEAQACGTPVIAFGAGGVLETIIDGVTGRLYQDPTVDGLASAIVSFSPERYDRSAIRRHADQFSVQRFYEGLDRTVGRLTRTSHRERGALIEELLAEAG